jgi:hypothetical protein
LAAPIGLSIGASRAAFGLAAALALTSRTHSIDLSSILIASTHLLNVEHDLAVIDVRSNRLATYL